MKIRFAALTALAALSVGTACGAQLLPKDTEVWTPEPPVVAPGAQPGAGRLPPVLARAARRDRRRFAG